MIIDQTTLAGRGAYLVDLDGNVNLAFRPAPNIGRWPKYDDEIGEGKIIDVEGINLQIESADLLTLYSYQARPILSLTIIKEMFPGLYNDPYAHRVHKIGGFDDFKRGRAKNIDVLEVEGTPTLVSVGYQACSWLSPIYNMPEPVSIDAVAWDLATARRPQDESFKYELEYRAWTGFGGGSPTVTVQLAHNLPPDAGRFKNIEAEVGNLEVVAYQIFFRANVKHDAYLRERYVGTRRGESLGRPLLRAVNVLEQVEPLHTLYSLYELCLRSGEHLLFEQGTEPPQRLTVSLDVAATLTKGESVELTVHHEGFTNVEARLDATVLVRPPAPDIIN
jgi:hypothetical protein